MATMSSPGIGTGGLDVKSIITQLVALEKRPLDTLKIQAATVNTKISAFGQIKSMVSTLADAAGKLTSVTGWNAVSTASSDSKFVSASAVGGTLPTSFNVEVQGLAKAQSTASQSVAGAVGAGTLKIELGKWAGAPGSSGFAANADQPSVEISVSASDTIADIASMINGANAGVTATILTDASGQRLLLSGKNTGEAAGFRVSVNEGDGWDTSDPPVAHPGNSDASGLSRVASSQIDGTATQQAADAKATVNGIAVTSASNSFADTVAGVTFKAEQVTEANKPITVTVSKDNSAIDANIDEFVKAYNAINQLLNDATKYDSETKSAGLFQGDSTAVGLQNMLRSAIQSVSTGSAVFQRLADVGITQKRGGDLEVDKTKLSKAMAENMDELKSMFRSTGGGAADGVAVKIKAMTANLLSTDGFFKSKDSALQMALKLNGKDQQRVNTRVDDFEKRITARYNALDTQLSSLNGLNAYISQQVAAWNKKTS